VIESRSRDLLVELARRYPGSAGQRFADALLAVGPDPVDVGFEPAEHFERIYRRREAWLRHEGVEVPGMSDAVERLTAMPAQMPIGVLGVDSDTTFFVVFLDAAANSIVAVIEAPVSLASPPPLPEGITSH
jgi:hypothetical protein